MSFLFLIIIHHNSSSLCLRPAVVRPSVRRKTKIRPNAGYSPGVEGERHGADAIDYRTGPMVKFYFHKKKKLKFAKVVKWIQKTSFTNNSYTLIVRPNLLVGYVEYPPYVICAYQISCVQYVLGGWASKNTKVLKFYSKSNMYSNKMYKNIFSSHYL